MVAVQTSSIRGIETQGAPTSARIVLGTVGVAAVALAITAMIFAQPTRTNP